MKICKEIAKAENFAKENDVLLTIHWANFIDDKHLDANDYPNNTEFMTMKYKGYLVNVYVGDWDSFKELKIKWIDYDIFDLNNDYELVNDGDDVYKTDNVLKAATDVKFYMNKIEDIISKKEC